MIDLINEEAIKAAVSIGKNLLGNRISQINDDLLERKREKKAKENELDMASEEISSLVLSEAEKLSFSMDASDTSTFESTRQHASEVGNWCESIKFSDMSSPKRLNEVYVQLDTYLMPKRTHMHEMERSVLLPLDECLLDAPSHCVVLGQPGAGKTTSMKKLCSYFFHDHKTSRYSFPILVRCRYLHFNNEGSSILSEIRNVIPYGISITDPSDSYLEANKSNLEKEYLIAILNYLKPLIVIDGFDEIPTHDAQVSVLEEIRFLTKLENSKVVVSCRTGEFGYELPNTTTYEIAPLSEIQIETYARKWMRNKAESSRFIRKIKQSPFWDTAIKPLTIAHLCAIYDRIKDIPPRPKTVYRKVVSLMIDQWDEQRSVPRISKFPDFRQDQKLEFLCCLSYQLTVLHRASVFSRTQILEVYSDICKQYQLEKESGDAIFNEIESHTGLFLQVGFERYEFAHKSIQEYLSSEYIVRLPNVDIIAPHVNILGAELAVAIAISSQPSEYFSEIVFNVIDKSKCSEVFFSAFLSRLQMEKPNFIASDSFYLSVCTILSGREYDKGLGSYIESDEEGAAAVVFSEYYDLHSSELSVDVVFKRSKDHPRYKLSPIIRFPSSSPLLAYL